MTRERSRAWKRINRVAIRADRWRRVREREQIKALQGYKQRMVCGL